MSATETQEWQVASCVDDQSSLVNIRSLHISPRDSVVPPVSHSLRNDFRTSPTSKKPKDDIRFYFRPVAREDIRVYFRPVSKTIIDRPRPPKTRVVPKIGKPRVRSRCVSPASISLSPQGPKVPPKAQALTSGQKNRDIFIAKQQFLGKGVLGRTNQNGSVALPGFDPIWATHPSSPLSPRITEVVDSSLLPSPLRKKSEVAAESAPEYDGRTDGQKYQTALEFQMEQGYQQSTVQDNQQTTLPYKSDNNYATLPALPVRLQKDNSQHTPQSPKSVRHRRQATPYSPYDVGTSSAFDSPELHVRNSSESDLVDIPSAYASSDALPTPVALEEWATERRRIAHGQPATIRNEKIVILNNNDNSSDNKDKDKTIKKTKSAETRLFRTKRGKSERREKEKKNKADVKKPPKSQDSMLVKSPEIARSPILELGSQDLHYSGARWDIATLPLSPEMVRPGVMTIRSDMDNEPRSDSISDKIAVEPLLVRAHTDESSMPTGTAKAKKPNKFVRMLEAYSKNVEGLHMVQ